jgi:hypothetical protein
MYASCNCNGNANMPPQRTDKICQARGRMKAPTDPGGHEKKQFYGLEQGLAREAP